MQSNEIVILTVIAIGLIAAIVIWLAFRRRHSNALRERFGDEYDRTVEARGGRGAAERDLEAREKRVAKLDIRPLTPPERERFTAEWHEVKAVFVDSPAEAVLHADRLLAQMMKTRGYPMADFSRRYEDLTVDHGDVARHYRHGHDLALRQERGEASTEDLRQAMKHYETLFDDLVSDFSDTVEHRPITRQAQHA